MTDCCSKKVATCDGIRKPQASWRTGAQGGVADALEHFSTMLDRSVEYCRRAKAEGRPIVGIMCEYTPREVILAAGGVPVCLCGGSASVIPAAEEVLPSNLCPLIKSTFGFHLLKNNPLLEMADLVVAETTCDGKKKMYELMGQSRRMYVLELPQKQDDPDALQHWRREVVKLKEYLEELFSVIVSEEKLKSAIALMNRERALRRRLAETMQAAAAPLTGRQLLELKSSVSGMPEDLACYQRLLAALEQQCGASSGSADAVRVLLTGVPIVHGAERVLELIESHGGLTVCMENCTGVKPLLEDVDEASARPLEAVADKYFHLPCSVQTHNRRRLAMLEKLVEFYRPECIVELIWHACLTYDVEAALVKQLAERLQLPYLRITTDYSPSDSARITMRVEALFETVRSARARTSRAV